MHVLRNRLLDAQQALSFLVSQATYIEQEVDRVLYPEIQYPALIPMDFSAPEWTKSVTYFSMDRVGQAQWFAGQARDVPRADVNLNRQETTVSMAAIGYGYDIEELSQAQQLGIQLNPEKAEAARRAYEEFLDRALLWGAAEKGYVGLLNDPSITTVTAANGASGTATWSTKTPDEKLLDINTALTGVYTGTGNIELADTILLPLSQLITIGNQPRSANSDTTILNFLREANTYSAISGQRLTIRGVRGLETAGAGGTARMVAYRKDPKALKAHMPMRHRFLPAMQTGPLLYEVPGIFRFGGLDKRRPLSMRYVDGI